MENKLQQLRNFFNHYCEVFNSALKTETAETDQTARLFSTCFIAANPYGVNCGQNNDEFRKAMESGYAFYRSIGITSMDIISTEITILDEFHAMTRVRWKSIFLKDGATGSIEFDNIYFTQTKDAEHKVFAYITGDEQKALTDAGLVQP